MFPVDQLARFEANNPTYRLLKPWWEVLTDYLAAAMLVVALFSGAMQATQGKLICLPAFNCPIEANTGENESLSKELPSTLNNFCSKYNSTNLLPRTTDVVLTKLPDRRQYDFVDAVCGQTAVHWFASYFPFILFLEAVILLIVDNFWLKFPRTASTLENFAGLVTECFNSPGTCLAVSNTLWGTRIAEDTLEGSNYDDRGTIQDTERQPLLNPTVTVTDAKQQPHLSTQLTQDSAASLEVAEAIKAKTLCEKVKQFREDQEPRHCIRNIYFTQAVLQSILSIFILLINSHHYHNLQSSVKCEMNEIISENYMYFKCSQSIIPYFQITFVVFLVLIFLYFLTSVFIFFWTCEIYKTPYDFEVKLVRIHFNIRRFSFRNPLWKTLQLSDITPAKGDFSFFLYLLDAYNRLYTYRFSVFLSQKNEKKLKQFLHQKEWPIERLRAIAEDNGRTLKLSNLRGIPKSVFKMWELDTLKFECCALAEDDFEPEDWQSLRLRLLSLIQCGLTSIPQAVLGIETLEMLDLSQNRITSIPQEVVGLRYLHLLNISNNKITDGVQNIIAHHKIRVLDLRRNESLRHFPEPVNELALRQLYVDEDIAAKMSSETKEVLKDILVTDNYSKHFVIKYLPEKAPLIEQARKDNDKVYKMTSKPKGLALVFNNQLYNTGSHLQNRPGSDIDARMLCDLFTGMGYHVDYQQDLKGCNFTKQLLDIIMIDNAEMLKCDSVIVAVLSHGSEEGIIFPDEEVVAVEAIVETVCDIEDYRGKPKLFFIHACRGRRRIHDRPSQMTNSVLEMQPKTKEFDHPPRAYLSVSHENPSDTSNVDLYNMTIDAASYQADPLSRSVSVNVPVAVDVLISYSSLPRKFRNTRSGSWYISSIVEVFSKYAWEEDVLSLMTYVNYEVSRKCKTMDGYRQVPVPQTTLTKKLFFLPGYFDEESQET